MNLRAGINRFTSRYGQGALIHFFCKQIPIRLPSEVFPDSLNVNLRAGTAAGHLSGVLIRELIIHAFCQRHAFRTSDLNCKLFLIIKPEHCHIETIFITGHISAIYSVRRIGEYGTVLNRLSPDLKFLQQGACVIPCTHNMRFHHSTVYTVGTVFNLIICPQIKLLSLLAIL